ncbi:CPCC family cysteine-rich protein [Peribacillus asahii]|uniref:CPCC family cysteine-rich protein n=1 Tax=Peribacillus asahii TaxID=228899 RepID=UPI003818D872
MKYTCPCCGYKTLDEEPPGTYAICEICFWEDDSYQYKYPDEDGANAVSFREAQQNFMKFWACDEGSLKYVRKPNKEDIKDPNWKPFI